MDLEPLYHERQGRNGLSPLFACSWLRTAIKAALEGGGQPGADEVFRLWRDSVEPELSAVEAKELAPLVVGAVNELHQRAGAACRALAERLGELERRFEAGEGPVASHPPGEDREWKSAAPAWPDPPAREAWRGLSGRFVRLVEPHTEADPTALLLQFLVAFGSLIGRTAYCLAEADRHHTNLFAVLVGTTSRGRKGSSWGHVRRPMEAVDDAWAGDRVVPGLSSGEGLIWAVRDPIETEEAVKEKGKVVGRQAVLQDPGEADKRLFVLEAEFASPLQMLKREGNILSSLVRSAWDTGQLRTLTKNSPAKATGAHISILGHVTKDELLRHLADVECGNGFGNRFLWACVRRSKLLPHGGRIGEVDFAPLVRELGAAVSFAGEGGELRRDAEAEALWEAVYPDLTEDRPGLLGAITARAEAQVLRLSLVYALLDRSPMICREHLEAALALWRYCDDSARFIFGEALGDPLADELLRVLRASPEGLTRTELHHRFGRHRQGADLSRALGMLQERALAQRERVETGGRTAERWSAVRPQKHIGTREVSEVSEERSAQAPDAGLLPQSCENEAAKECEIRVLDAQCPTTTEPFFRDNSQAPSGMVGDLSPATGPCGEVSSLTSHLFILLSVGERASTPQGAGTVWQVFADRIGVKLDSTGQVAFFEPGRVTRL